MDDIKEESERKKRMTYPYQIQIFNLVHYCHNSYNSIPNKIVSGRRKKCKGEKTEEMKKEGD
jgi:hypothetical protein